jgi:phosphate-selective porin OprO/OprP
MKFLKERRHAGRFLTIITCFAGFVGWSPAEAAEEGSRFDDVWDLATLYKGEEDSWVRKVALTGRFQLDYAHLDGDGTRPGAAGGQELDLDEWNIRRLRAGGKVGFRDGFTLHVEVDFDVEEDPVYRRLTDAAIAWSASDALEVKVGKQGMNFTLDGSTSSKELLTIDRNNLSNNLWFTNEYMPGVAVEGKQDGWLYGAGLFSRGGQDEEFGDFDAGVAGVVSVGRDFQGVWGLDEAVVSADLMCSEKDLSDPSLFTNRLLGQVASLRTSLKEGDFGFRGDVAAADGYGGQPDMAGFVLMPYMDLPWNLQAVLRYTFVESDGNNGLRFTNYEAELLDGGRGDRYQELYAGLNHYIYGHKLKLQTGLSWIRMEDAAADGGDFDGLSWITGLRVAW